MRFRSAGWVLPSLLAIGCASPQYGGDPDANEADARTSMNTASGKNDAGGALLGSGTNIDPDAGEPDIMTPTVEANPDGGAPLISAVPAWATPLLGRYAVRFWFFSQDTTPARARARASELHLVDFVQLDEGTPQARVEMRFKVCEARVEGEAAVLTVLHPEALVQRRQRVLFGNQQQWSTQSVAVADGFTREPPAKCSGKGGMQVAKDPAQKWIAGDSCTCPQSIDSTPTLNDCRVVDGDGDGKPGNTWKFQPMALLGPADLYAAMLNQTSFTRGTVAQDRHHHALVALDQRGTQLSCDPLGCADLTQVSVNCSVEQTGAEYAYLGAPEDAAYDCEQVKQRVAELFPTALPGYPASCP